MSEEQDQKRGFKVDDRRRFSDTGDPRSSGEEPLDTPSTSESPATAEADPVRSAAPASAHEDDVRSPGEITFSTFALSLSTQALAHLGEIPSPFDGQVSKDLIAAKQLIDILGILQDKTKGNLAPAEAGLLTNVLYDLRLKYVEQAKKPT